jgi:hypothetical protein
MHEWQEVLVSPVSIVPMVSSSEKYCFENGAQLVRIKSFVMYVSIFGSAKYCVINESIKLIDIKSVCE